MKLHLLAFSLLLFLAACGKSEEPSADSGGDGGTQGGSNASAPMDADKPWEDTAKPYLSDQKMGDFVASLKDPNTPFAVFESGVSVMNSPAKMKEFDAAVRKHGFKDGEEYLGAWSRIVAASTQVVQNESNESMINSQEEMIKTAQEALKKPDLTADQRTVYEQQVTMGRQTIETYKQMKQTGVNEQDIATFKKHKAAFEAAFNERKKPQGDK